jgi:TonB family protein
MLNFFGCFFLCVITVNAQPLDYIHYAKNDTTIYTMDYLNSLLYKDTSRKINAWGYFHKSKVDSVHYPLSAREEGLQGIVKVSCVVEKDGRLSNLVITKGISPDLDREAIRSLKESTINNPFLVNGIPIRVRLVLPVIFTLND